MIFRGTSTTRFPFLTHRNFTFHHPVHLYKKFFQINPFGAIFRENITLGQPNSYKRAVRFTAALQSRHLSVEKADELDPDRKQLRNAVAIP